jgi:hypothetical protein
MVSISVWASILMHNGKYSSAWSMHTPRATVSTVLREVCLLRAQWWVRFCVKEWKYCFVWSILAPAQWHSHTTVGTVCVEEWAYSRRTISTVVWSMLTHVQWSSRTTVSTVLGRGVRILVQKDQHWFLWSRLTPRKKVLPFVREYAYCSMVLWITILHAQEYLILGVSIPSIPKRKYCGSPINVECQVHAHAQQYLILGVSMLTACPKGNKYMSGVASTPNNT